MRKGYFMSSNKVFRKDIEVLKGKTKDRFMGIYRENLHPSSSFDVPTFLNKSASQYAYEHPENCEVLLISKKIWGKPMIQDAIGVLYRSLSNQSKDNENADYRSRIGVCSDLSGSLSIGHYNYNPTPFSCIPSVKYQSDTGHLGYRLEFKETSLSSQTNHIVEAYDTLKKKGKKSYKYAITDECLLLTENLKSFKGIEEFCQNYEDYIAVINLGVMTKESFNYHLENDAISHFVDNDYKVYLSKEVYNELIPIREYNADYAWKMTSPLHFLNCISNLPFLRLLCGCLGHLFQGIEEDSKYQNIVSTDKLHTLSNLYEITRNRLKGSSNFYYSVGKGDSLDDFSRITLRLVTCFNEKKENGKLKSFIYFTDVTIEKKNVPTVDKKSVKVNPVVSFSKPIIKEIPNFSECDDDTIEDFIRDYFTKYPVISYGLRGIFQTALKKLNRDCISGCNVERTVYYLDLDDILNSFSMEKNEKLNKEYSKKRDNAPFYFESSCVDMGSIIPEEFLKGSPIRATASELSKDLKILYNNIQKYKGKNNLKENDAISLLPLLYILYTSVSLLTAKGIAYDTLSRIDFYYPPILKVPNGDYNYSDLITQYCESGLLMGINVGEEAKKNGYKDYYYMPYDMLEGMDNILLGVNDEVTPKSDGSFDFHNFGVSLDNFNTDKPTLVSSEDDVDLSLKEVLEDAKDSFNDTLSDATCSFCDAIAEQGAEHGDRNPKGYFYVDEGGPVDKKEMKSKNIVVDVEDKEISTAELAALSEPEGQPRVDYSMDKDVGFGESVEAPDLKEELSKLNFDFNAMKDKDEPDDIDAVEDVALECAEEVEDKIEETFLPDNSEEMTSTDTSFISDLLNKDNGFTENQILLLVKKKVISIEDMQSYLISKIQNIKDISMLLKLLKEL